MTKFVPIAVLAGVLAVSTAAVAADNAALVKRGEYLVNGPAACANCHTPRNPDFSLQSDKNLAGGFHLVDAAFDVYSANITPDKETGIGTWTDDEIARAIRQGVDKEGKVIFPPMPVPTYNNMSDDDVKAIVAYLRTVPAVHNEVPESKSKWNIPQQAMPTPAGKPAPPPDQQVAYGGYLVTAVMHCFECHTTPDEHGVPDVAHHLGAGGMKIDLGPGMSVMTANITSDKDTGLGSWSAADIKKALTEGLTPTGGHLSPPMPFPWFKTMTDQDLDAVVAFIQTLPPISNKVERTDFQKKAFP